MKSQAWFLVPQFIDKHISPPLSPTLTYIKAYSLIMNSKFDAAAMELQTCNDIILSNHDPEIPFSLRLLWACIPANCENHYLAVERLTSLFVLCEVCYDPTIEPPQLSVFSTTTLHKMFPGNNSTKNSQNLSPIESDLFIDPLTNLIHDSTNTQPPSASSPNLIDFSPIDSPTTAQSSQSFNLQLIPAENKIGAPITLIRTAILLAYVYVRLERHTEALGVLDRIVDKVPQSLLFHIYALIFRILLDVGAWEAAERYLQEMQSLSDPNSPTSIFYLHRGLLQLARGRFSFAHDSFSSAVASDPLNLAALNNLAVSHLGMVSNLKMSESEGATEKIRTAIKTLEDSIRANPYTTLHEALVSTLLALYSLLPEDTTDQEIFIKRCVKRYGPAHFAHTIDAD
ncbi:hypothetical protein BLNAU_670 [Blattamonas nauphoetae]|uniref:Uncharacterized protein n=1 Tax=Blattamonas nauphoetae TaxID=2049346 RepID=A0ABQ9YK56_9EUKA|nr:hypothetical protein BLNAU_670 [Blattamonas nauphoetae]